MQQKYFVIYHVSTSRNFFIQIHIPNVLQYKDNKEQTLYDLIEAFIWAKKNCRVHEDRQACGTSKLNVDGWVVPRIAGWLLSP